MNPYLGAVFAAMIAAAGILVIFIGLVRLTWGYWMDLDVCVKVYLVWLVLCLIYALIIFHHEEKEEPKEPVKTCEACGRRICRECGNLLEDK